LAQCNIVKLRALLDSPDVTGFVAALDPINALADSAPGFVWRLQTDDGDATGVRVFADDQILLNMSVWESMEALKQFVYRSGHKEVLRRRREWADRFAGVQSTMWWLRAGCLPEPTDAVARLEALQRLGPTQYAFTFQAPFDAPAEVESN
jgi:heme-degrading monooxygenase HmoA